MRNHDSFLNNHLPEKLPGITTNELIELKNIGMNMEMSYKSNTYTINVLRITIHS